MKMRLLLVGSWALFVAIQSVPLLAQGNQTTPVNTDHSSVGTQPGAEAQKNRSNNQLTAQSSNGQEEPVLYPKRERLDKKFWALWAPAIVLTIADVEITASCVQRAGCYESNPVYGPHPSRLRLYAIRGGITGVAFYLSQRWKRDRHGITIYWNYLPVALTAINGFAVAWDAAHLAGEPHEGSGPIAGAREARTGVLGPMRWVPPRQLPLEMQREASGKSTAP